MSITNQTKYESLIRSIVTRHMQADMLEKLKTSGEEQWFGLPIKQALRATYTALLDDIRILETIEQTDWLTQHKQRAETRLASL